MSSNAFYPKHTHAAVAGSAFKEVGREHKYIILAEIGVAEISVKIHLRQDYPLGGIGFVGKIKGQQRAGGFS